MTNLCQMLHVILQRCGMFLTRQQQLANVLPRVDSAFKPAVHSPPELDQLRAEIRSDDVIAGLAWSVKWIDVLVHVIRHITPQRKGFFSQFQINSILFAVSDESSKLTAHDVIVEDQKKAFVEFEGVWTLLHQLPSAVEELCEDRGYLGVAKQSKLPLPPTPLLTHLFWIR